jgi:hypothetical protein
MDLGGTGEASEDEGRRAAGGGVGALDDAGAEIAEGAVLQGREYSQQTTALRPRP